MDNIVYQEGLIIEHPKLKNCGRGKILSVRDTKVEVLFSNGQTKKFDTAYLPLIMSEDQSDPCPSVRHSSKQHSTVNRKPSPPRRNLPSFQESIDEFIRHYPQGFSDPEYIKDERTYKLNTHELFQQILGNGQIKQFLADSNIDELTKRTLRVITEHKINLIYSKERIAFTDALKSKKSVDLFFNTLAELLEAGPTDDAINNYFKAVGELSQTGKSSPNKWTVSTLFPYLADPDRFMFLKPESAKDCADQLSHSLNYKATPNLLTYRCLESLYDRLLKHDLKSLEPKDNIDVQSFIWLVRTYRQ